MTIKDGLESGDQGGETLWSGDDRDGCAHVGMVLRARRLAQGRDVAQITQALRIRAGYLEAIETAQYKQLPGLAYAVGFVRSYADYLGLDSAEMVARFKQESKGIERRTVLTLPSPAPQGRIPGTGPLLVGLVAFTVLAGIWYFWRDDVAGFTGRVAQIPEELLARSVPATGGPLAPLAPPPPPATAHIEAAPAIPTDTGPVPPQPPIPLLAKPTQRSAIAPVTVDSSEETEDGSTPPPTALGKASALLADPPAEETAPPLLPSSAGTALSQPLEGKIYGMQGGEARVVIRSRGESWIQIRDGEGQAIFTRVLRSGDVYRVPLRAGLSLMTGNAGAIELVVDGVTLPPLGGAGIVRRNVPLDIDRLRSGSNG